jgi:luciferase family oxidoreductase group 1
MTTLSVLDLAIVVSGGDAHQALAETTEMAIEAERLGLERFWVAEHHGMPGIASSAPAVLLAHLAAHTTSLRVGSGGVMLPNHAALVVAEQFGTLEALHPGRIDLGIGRAPGTDLRTAKALGRGNANHFPDQLVELISYFTGQAEQLAMPGRGAMPELWLLGSSTFSAQLAGHLGLPFAFAFHFSPERLDEALAFYRATFQPSAVLERPKVLVGAAVICAPTTEEASYLAGPGQLSMLQLRQGRPGQMPTFDEAAAYSYSPAEAAEVEQRSASHIIGDPEVVGRGIVELVARTAADEIMLSIRVPSFEERRRSLELTVEVVRSVA